MDIPCETKYLLLSTVKMKWVINLFVIIFKTHEIKHFILKISNKV